MTTYTTFDWTFNTTFGDGKPVTQAFSAREAVFEILSEADKFGGWSFGNPEIQRWEDSTIQQKENKTTPTIYLHRPDADDVNRFDGNSEDMTEDESLRASIWVLEDADGSNFDLEFNVNFGQTAEQLARSYRNDVLNILKAYLRDNYENTEHQFLEPDTSTDFRPQTNHRRTDHYIYTVEVDAHRLVESF